MNKRVNPASRNASQKPAGCTAHFVSVQPHCFHVSSTSTAAGFTQGFKAKRGVDAFLSQNLSLISVWVPCGIWLGTEQLCFLNIGGFPLHCWTASLHLPRGESWAGSEQPHCPASKPKWVSLLHITRPRGATSPPGQARTWEHPTQPDTFWFPLPLLEVPISSGDTEWDTAGPRARCARLGGGCL